MSETPSPSVELTWTEISPEERLAHTEWERAALVVARGVFRNRYQESSSWHEEEANTYTVLEVMPALYVVVKTRFYFNNDGLSDAQRENYQGEEEVQVCPISFSIIDDARAAADRHFADQGWTLEEALA